MKSKECPENNQDALLKQSINYKKIKL